MKRDKETVQQRATHSLFSTEGTFRLTAIEESCPLAAHGAPGQVLN